MTKIPGSDLTARKSLKKRVGGLAEGGGGEWCNQIRKTTWLNIENICYQSLDTNHQHVKVLKLPSHAHRVAGILARGVYAR